MIVRLVTMTLAMVVLLSAGCADEPETGRILGTVMVIGGPAPGDPRPPSSAEVLIRGDGDRTYTARVTAEGTFDQEVDAGHYTATVTFDAGNECGDPRRVSTQPGGEATLDFACPVHGAAVTDHDPRVAQISKVIGCDSVRGTSTGFEFDPGSAAFVCAVDGEDLALIHLFDHRDRAGMVSGFELRIDRAALNPCPDGTRPPGPWIVVGYDWAASSFQRELMSALSSSLDAEFIGGGSAQDDPPVGPPASYLVPGYCIVGT